MDMLKPTPNPLTSRLHYDIWGEIPGFECISPGTTLLILNAENLGSQGINELSP